MSDKLRFVSDIIRVMSNKIRAMSDIWETLSDIFTYLSDNTNKNCIRYSAFRMNRKAFKSECTKGLSDKLWFVSDMFRVMSEKISVMSDIWETLSDIYTFLSDNPKSALVRNCQWVAETGPLSQTNKVPPRDEYHFKQKRDS